MTDTLFAGLQAAPADPILGIQAKFHADPRPEKVNLGVGMYLDENGVTPVLDVVREAKEALLADGKPHTYIPMSGLPAYGKLVQQLVFGEDSEIVQSGRAATIQSLGGTGALKVACDFMHWKLGACSGAASQPTWGNHYAILAQAGFEVSKYRYYDAQTNAICLDSMLEDLGALPEGSLVILHSCCHNPTGYDISMQDWKRIVDLCAQRKFTPLLDMAYQGFGEGLDQDAAAIRLFAESGMSFLLATSFSKSFNLYSERIGALTVVTQSKQEADVVMTQLKSVIRANYSNPPAFGGRIVEYVLSDKSRRDRWVAELDAMRARIRKMREMLACEIARLGCKRDFSFVTSQNGMFSFTGLTPEQMDRLASEFGVYGVRNGRICICGLTEKNVAYVAKAIAAVCE